MLQNNQNSIFLEQTYSIYTKEGGGVMWFKLKSQI